MATFAVGFVVRADRRHRARRLCGPLRPAQRALVADRDDGVRHADAGGSRHSFATIGIAAPIIVVLGRVVQGISIGGEFASANRAGWSEQRAAPPQDDVPAPSRCPRRRWGGCWPPPSGLGVLLTFPPATIQDGAWRIPFLIGSLIGPFGFYVRYRMAESPEFQKLMEHKKDVARAPVREVLQRHWLPLICAIGLTIIGTSLTYIWNTYLPTYVVEQLHLPLWQGLLGVAVTSAIGVGTCVLGGWLADVYGPYRMFFLFTAISALISYPFLPMCWPRPASGGCSWPSWWCSPCSGCCRARGLDSWPACSRSKCAPPAWRSRIISASTVFGGFAPLTVTWLIATTGNKLMPAFYIIARRSSRSWWWARRFAACCGAPPPLNPDFRSKRKFSWLTIFRRCCRTSRHARSRHGATCIGFRNSA